MNHVDISQLKKGDVSQSDPKTASWVKILLHAQVLVLNPSLF